MQLGCSMYSYVKAVQAGRLDLASFIAEVASLGLKGVELLDFFYKDPKEERKTAAKALADHGLECCVFSVANNFAQSDQALRQAALDRVRFGVDEAAYYGADVVRVFAGNLPQDGSVEAQDARSWIVDGLVRAANYANDHGVRLALENHGKLAGKGSQVRGIIEDVRRECGHKALGANPDTGNFLLVGEQGHEGVAEVADMAHMVHFKDFARDDAGVYEGLPGERFAGTVVGEGEVDLAACVGVLRQAGFTGWLNLEYEGEEDPMSGVPKSVASSQAILGA